MCDYSYWQSCLRQDLPRSAPRFWTSRPRPVLRTTRPICWTSRVKTKTRNSNLKIKAKIWTSRPWPEFWTSWRRPVFSTSRQRHLASRPKGRLYKLINFGLEDDVTASREAQRHRLHESRTTCPFQSNYPSRDKLPWWLNDKLAYYEEGIEFNSSDKWVIIVQV